MTAENFPSSFFSNTAASPTSQVDIAGAVVSAQANATAAGVSAAAASVSATSASTSSGTATTQAATSTAQAVISTTQATNAASSASAASTSASTATTQASTATTQASNASTSAGTATTQAANASSSASAAAASATTASTGASTATTQASTATTQASNASTSAGNALTSANTASTAATTATTQATNAAASASGIAGYAQSWQPDTTRPTLLLDFSGETLDARLTFTRTGTATRVNKFGIMETIATGLPRFDYDPATLQFKGLLVEEARTNLHIQSQTLDNASWSKSAATVTADTALTKDPFGTNLADILVEDTTTAIHQLSQNLTVASSTSYTLSFYAKAAARTTLAVFSNNASGSVTATFDLSAITTSAPSASLGATNPVCSIVDVGNGWRRIILSYTTGPSQTAANTLIRLNNGTTYLGDGVSGTYLFGVQMEAGVFSTSYIPTTTAAVTRNAETCKATGANFTSWFNNAGNSGTFLVDAVFGNARETTNRSVMALSAAGSFTNSTYLGYSTAGGNGWVFAQATGNSIGFPTGFASTLGSVKLSIGFAGQAAINGGSGGYLDTPSSPVGTIDLSALDSLYVGANWNGGTPFNGWVRAITYWPRQLPTWAVAQVTHPDTMSGNSRAATALYGTNATAPSATASGVASAVNYLTLGNAVTGAGPFLGAAGTDANVDLNVFSQGTGSVVFSTNGTVPQGKATHTASAVNFLAFTGSTTTNKVTLSTAGSDANPGLLVSPKGTGGLVLGNASGVLGFFAGAGAVKATVSGSKSANAALGSLMTALAAYGIVTDTTTA